MSLPVSSYEELLARVRSLTHETIQLQRELTTPISNSTPSSLQLDHNENERLETSLVLATCGADDYPRGLTNDVKTNFSPREPPPACEQHRPNSFQRPLLSNVDEHRSWSMSHRKPSSRRERSRTTDTVGCAPTVRSSSGKPRGEGPEETRLAKDKEQGPPEPKEQDEHRTDAAQGIDGAGAIIGSSSEDGQNIASLYHGTWPVERGLWHSGPTMIGGSRSLNQDACSVMSFSCSVGSCGGSAGGGSSQRTCNQQLGAKVEMVYSLLSMLGTHDREDMSRTLLAMSSSPDSCQAMRQSGCLPLLVQFLHVPDQPAETRLRASQALHNVVHSQADDKRGRREARVLRLLEQVRDYCDSLRQALQAVALAEDLERPAILDDMERHPGPTIAALMKLSFDEEHRHAMCQLGGLHAIAELIQLDHEAHGSTTSDQYCVTLRRYAGMALTNLTFGDGTNKALLCSFRQFMKTLVAQLCSPSEDLRQVTASVLRNLSWRADGASKQMLREVSAVPGLMHAAMEGKKEATLKSILSALWNLSAHCTMNKVDICAVEGALGFLVEMLSYNAPSKTLAIVENAGGILRNISSHIAIREDYRAMLRHHNCLQVLLQQLKSPSLTIVSNACGTLWNLSARCPEDQRALWDMGAVNMLRSLVHSKHKMISMGSSAALKNLLGAKPNNNYPLDSTAKSLGLPALPSLYVRKQKALEQELDQNLAETCDNIEPSTSPSGLRDDKFVFSPTERFNSDGRHRLFRCHYQNQARHKTHVSRSDSRDSVTSTLSDTVYERISRNNDVLSHTVPSDGVIRRDSERSSSIHGTLGHTEPSDYHLPDNVTSDKKFLRRYTNTMKQREDKRLSSLEVSDDNILEPASVHGTEELGSPYSRLGHSDEGSEKMPIHTDSNERDNQGAQTQVPYNSNPSYPSRPNSTTYTRNKFSDLEIDPGVQEEPVDYSLKYKEQSQAGIKSLETCKIPDVKVEDARSNQNDLGRGYALRNQASVSTSKNIKMNVVYGDYAETDLDQPTDYSLKYAEEDEELEFAKISESQGGGEPVQFYEGSSPILEDTLKTYYTEGTPYETPYNFSTATSMSDLRCEQTSLPEKKEDKESYPTSDLNTENFHESSTEKELQMKYLPVVTKPPLQDMQSGLMSPEKPVQYCEEGTPGLFSRVSSLSSLNSIPIHADNAPGNVDVSSSEDIKRCEVNLVKDQAAGNTEKDEPKEGKVVTFGSTDHYAEETPLMFSRCSSLGSLSSFEQHSIHDDRSSVISDFSRRTSGIVSPSELPDSPTQSVPSSPHQNKTHSFPSHLPDNLARDQSSSRQASRSSVFEDDLTAFKEEDTPIEFSRATSLSSLTIDDEPKICNDSMTREIPKLPKTAVPAGIHHVRRAEREKEEGMEKQDVEKEKRDLSDCCELAPVSEGEEDDEDMLAACITIGMQGGRHKTKTTPPRPGVQGAMRARLSGIPLKSSPRQHPQTRDTSMKSTSMDLPGVCEDALLTYCTEGTPATTSHAGSHSDLSILSFPCDTDENEARKRELEEVKAKESDKVPNLDLERPDFSDDSSNFSGDNDNILAECIQSGMPKARTPRKVFLQPGTMDALPPQDGRRPVRRPLQFQTPSAICKKDEVEVYTTEGSPCTFSTRSSLSDLTVSTEGGAPGVASCLRRPARSRPLSEGASCDPSLRFASDVPTEDTPLCFATEDTPLEVSHAASLSSLTSADQDEPLFPPKVCNPSDLSWESPSFKVFNKTTSVSEDVVTVLSRNGSLSSLSVDSFGSTEPTPSEQALLEQCINSGMPKSKEASRSRLNSVPKVPARLLLEEQRLESGMACLTLDETTKCYVAQHAPKNGVSPSAVTSLTAPTAADVGGNVRAEGSNTTNPQDTEVNGAASLPALAHEVTRACINHDFKANIVKEFSSEEVSSRLQMGDAMMESLTRQTEDLELRCGDKSAELSVMKQSGELSVMKQSTDRDTWNDDSSPNDVSFPSMSSAPLIGSFRSEGRDNGCLSQLAEESDASQPPPCEMTHSSIIHFEAQKLITAFHVEGQNNNYDQDMEHSITSLNSMDLDAIKPPSMMNSLVSLTTSLSEFGDADDRSSLLRGRHSKKKAFPTGVMVRRALGNNHNSIDSLLDNASLSSVSQIDNVKPPSAMDELIDLADMENSMISVASITSEVADLAKEGFQSESAGNGDGSLDLLQSPASTLKRTSDAGGNFKSALHDCLDFNAETGTDTICSDTEICEDPAYTHTIDCEDPAYTHTLDDVDAPDLPSDGTPMSTPMTSDLSSAESTPKKRQKPRLLTPKQKRQLVKDRYRTYTISAEEERQLEKERKLKISLNHHITADNANVENLDIEQVNDKGTAKMTPKQRRLEDRSRFQTRVLDKTSKAESIIESPETNHQTYEKNKVTGIPKFGAKKNIKTLKEKRAAAKERFRTRTLSDDVSVVSQGSSSTSSQRDDVPVKPTPEEVETLLRRDANLVICTLNENRGRSESDDMMLDCETLSLVSLESESEHHSKKQTVTQQNSLEMGEDGEEKTYVAEPLTPMDDGDDMIPLEEDRETEVIGPRISKPCDLPLALDKGLNLVNTDGETAAPKCVRGRRKALYSSPVGRYGQNSSSARVQTASSTPVRGTKSSALRQKPAAPLSRVVPVSTAPKPAPKMNKLIKSVNGVVMTPVKLSTPNSAPVTPKSTVTSRFQRTAVKTVPSDGTEARFKPPERQGTFTKEDSSTIQCIPLPTSPSKTRIPVPASTPTDSPKLTLSDKKNSGSVPLKTPRLVGSKVNVRSDLGKTTRPKTAPNRLAKTLSLDGDTCKVPQTNKFVSKTKPVLLRECGWVNKKGELKSSASSQSLQSQRSASNSSLNSVDSTGAASRVRKKEVTSKIASLWKKVEESKHKQKYVQKDTRVWITAQSKQEEIKETEKVHTNLVRSSTFDGTSCKTEALEGPPKPKTKPGTRSSKLIFTKGGKSYQSGDNFTGNSESNPQSNHKLPVAEVTGTVKPKGEQEDVPKVVMRCKSSSMVGEVEGEESPQQRLSRLGSFFCMEGTESEFVKPSSTRGPPASAIVSPFNYNPPGPVTPSHIPTLVKSRTDETPTEPKQNTASMRVTTV